MFTKREVMWLAILLSAGFLLALKLVHIDYMVNFSQGYTSFCNINSKFNCDAVAASSYSFIFGVPVALLGTLANLFLAIFWWWGRQRPLLGAQMKKIFFLVFFLISLGCLFLAAISFFKLSSFCILCMAYWTVSIATFVYLWRSIQSDLASADFITSLLIAVKAEWKMVGLLKLLFLGALVGITLGFFHKAGGLHGDGARGGGIANYQTEQNLAIWGDPSRAFVPITFYTDFQCPWCKKGHGWVIDLQQRYSDKIYFIRKDFPIDRACNPRIQREAHLYACRAAQMAKCMGQRNRYWEFHDRVYEDQERLNEDYLRKYIEEQGIDVAAIEACAESEEIKALVRADLDEATRYRVEATPTFRIFSEVLDEPITEAIINDYLNLFPYLTPSVVARILANKAVDQLRIFDLRAQSEHQQSRLIMSEWAADVAAIEAQLKGASLEQPILLYGSDKAILETTYKALKDRGYLAVHILQGNLADLKGQVGAQFIVQ